MRNRNVCQRLAIVVCLCIAGTSGAGQSVIYVDGAATGGNDGSSWTDAYVSLHDTLMAAEEATEPLEVRVAQGTYASGRDSGFEPSVAVVLRGGYAGVAGTDPNARDVGDYGTILENHPALRIRNVTSSIAVDGFTIVPGPFDTGVYIRNVNLTFVDCHFVSTGILTYAIDAWDCNCVLTRCQFEGKGGDGISCQDGHLTLTDCTFAQMQYSAVDGSGTVEMLRCSFVDNAIAVSCRGTFTARDCTFVGNGGRWEAIFCSGNSTFVDCRFINNRTTGISAGGLDLSGDRATLTRCLFAGNSNSEWGNGAINSHVSVLKLSHCLFIGNKGGEGRPGAVGHGGPILRVSNCTFADNRGQPNSISHGPLYGIAELSQCIVRDGPDPFKQPLTVSYSNVEGGYTGAGNADVDPGFVSPGYWDPNGTPDDPNDDIWVMGDYHLKSQAGHWDSETEGWVCDEITSPCIDMGDPNGPLGSEPFPNGGFVNLGAFGGTAEASRSYFGAPVCETQIAGDINGDCTIDDLDLEILTSHWLLDATPTVNIPPTLRIISPEDGAELTPLTPIIFRVEAYDPDGAIVQVEYTLEYDDGYTGWGTSIPLGDPTDGWAYEYEWSYLRYDGVYEIRAEAIDDDGARVVSPTITFTLHPADLE